MTEAVNYLQTIGEPEYFVAHDCHARELVPIPWALCSACVSITQCRQYTARQLTDEIVTLRAQLAAAREKVEKLDRWDLGGYCDGESGCCGESVECVPDGDYLDRAAVLAILGGAP